MSVYFKVKNILQKNAAQIKNESLCCVCALDLKSGGETAPAKIP